jgi:Spy/CpxP family protein refolding chaperone
MNSKMTKWLCGSSLAAVLAASAAAWSMGPPGGPDHDPTRMLAHISERLDLSAEQQASVESLLATSRQANAADRKRLGELREQIMAMRADFDAGKAQTIADEIGQITARMVFEGSKTWAEVYQQLTPDQRTQLDELVAKRESRRSKWHRGAGASQD